MSLQRPELGPGQTSIEVTANRPRATTPGSPTRLVIHALVSLGLVVAIFSFLLHGIDPAEVGAEIRAMTWIEGAILAAITAWNLATYALVEMAVKPGLGFWRAIVLTQAATAASNTVPVQREHRVLRFMASS